jgi:prepilin signal peptidase PulO-like enzyme (type II secretory pathway)
MAYYCKEIAAMKAACLDWKETLPMTLAITLYLTVFFAILGLLIGSFLNVCIYRLPRGESVVTGRSHCPACGHFLGPLDLVPVISFLALGRRCRYCQQPISPRYAQVESYAGALFAIGTLLLTPPLLAMEVSPGLLVGLPLADHLRVSFALVRTLIRYDRQSVQVRPRSSGGILRRFLLLDLVHLVLMAATLWFLAWR